MKNIFDKHFLVIFCTIYVIVAIVYYTDSENKKEEMYNSGFQIGYREAEIKLKNDLGQKIYIDVDSLLDKIDSLKNIINNHQCPAETVYVIRDDSASMYLRFYTPQEPKKKNPYEYRKNIRIPDMGERKVS